MAPFEKVPNMIDHIHAAKTEKDFTTAHALAMRFADSSPYTKYIDTNVVENIIRGAMRSEDSVVLLCGEVGMIIVTIVPFIYGTARMAVELAWWVDPQFRGGNVGRALLDAAEQWAKYKNVVGITMISLNDSVGEIYEKRGYKPYERTYMKEF